MGVLGLRVGRMYLNPTNHVLRAGVRVCGSELRTPL